MIKNFFYVSIRNILRNRFYSVITLLGLSAGLVAFLLIRLYVGYERSFDQFQEKGDRIFRVQQDRYNQGELTNQSVSICAAAGFAIKDNFPGVERLVNILYSPAVVTYETKVFEESHFYFVSKDFFRVFSVPLIEGIDSLVLSRPGTIAISRSTAKKYFGSENPIGKELDYRGVFKFEVTGIFEDFPSNSHMEIDLMGSFDTYTNYAGDRATTSWRWDAYYTYLLLRNKSDAAVIEAALPDLIETQTGDWLRESGQEMKLSLQPLTDIHLFSNFKKEMKVNGNFKMVYYLSLISYFIIIIAYINYVNVATAKSLERAKEVGIRKVLGGYRIQLMFQFLTESFLINLLAILVSTTVVYFILPYFALISGRAIDSSMMFSNDFILLLAYVLIGGTILAGLYPALVLSGFRPTEVLKGKLSGSSHGGVLRRGLIIMQFIAAITLIICTYVVYHQIKFLRTQSLGFNLDEVLIVKAPLKKDTLYANQITAFKADVLQLSSVKGMTVVRESPGAPIIEYGNSIRRLGAGPAEVNQFQTIATDKDFTEIFDVKVVAGRMYNENDPEDYSVIVINEMASELLGFKNPDEAINQQIIWPNDTLTVIGVLQNYHHETLKFPVSPILFPLDPTFGLFIPIRLSGGTPSTTIASIEALYLNHFPGNPFNAYFLDDHYEQQYRSDIRFGKVVGIFSAVAIVITCLGLFGLSSYTVILRMKEIGIRKVLGASDTSIVQLLCRDYTILITIAILLAVPVAWYVMNGWLENFANRVPLNGWLFAIPSVIVILIAWLTISSHVLRAATSNPVDIIRHE